MALGLFSIPGGSALTVLSLSLLSLIYFYLGFAFFNDIRLRNVLKKNSYKEISTFRILGAIAAGISLSFAILGILFKYMFWPGSFIMLNYGLATLLITIIVVLIKYNTTKSPFYIPIFKRSALFGGIALILTFISSIKLAEIKHRNDPKYAKALINAMENPDNQEFQEKLQEERKKMDEKNYNE